MTALRQRIAARIRAAGPIGVDEYMRLCLFDPDHGYYTTRDPFGARGDFVTAPDVSQMFGELVAAWLAAAWAAAGRPDRAVLAEIGPGRGALMADMARTLGRIAPAFVDGAEIVLIETSPRLAEIQRRKLANSPGRKSWVNAIADLPAGPLFIVGNELFDAVPVRQFVREGRLWRERLVTLDGDANLAFALGLPASPNLPAWSAQCGDGDVFEVSAPRAAIMSDIAARIAAEGGAGLFFDYGAIDGGCGDTLQALSAHAFEGVFDRPGEADLTTHVDFAALAAVARAAGLDAQAATQGAFLEALGISARAERLAAGKDAATAGRIAGERDRLIGDDRMGRLFKALAIARPGLPLYPFAGR